jgi:monovalent cation:H+ antiporter-2, CPA2 family
MTPPLWIFTLASETGGRTLAADLLVILGTAAIVATIFGRLKLESIPGFLLAGALVGPGALGLVADSPRIEQIADLAIVLLMFGIGLHLDVTTIRRGMANILGIGVASTLGTILFAWGIGMALGLNAPMALIVAMAISMSSTAVFVRLVQANRESRSAHSRVGLGISIVQDLGAVVMLAVLPDLARWAGGSPTIENAGPLDTLFDGLPATLEVVARALVGVSGVTLMIVTGKYILPRIMHEVVKVGSGELVLIASGAIAFTAAVGTRTLGFSAEMGAFLAGFLLASTPYRYQLSGQLSPMRDILMAIFFTAVGLKVDTNILIQDWWIVLIGVAVVLVGKTVSIALSAWALGMTASSAVLAGAYLCNAGEFGLVLLGAASRAGGLTDRVQGDAISIIIVSLVLSPLVIPIARRLSESVGYVRMAPWIRGRALVDTPAHSNAAISATNRHMTADGPDAATEPSAKTNPQARSPIAEGPDSGVIALSYKPRHVIIAGFGPVGRALADRLAVMGTPFAVVELNASTVQRQAVLGREVIYGDITNQEVLEKAGIQHADAVLLTIPDDQATFRACKAIREASPTVFIAARTSFLSGKFVAMQLGADVVTVEEVATAVQMEREVLAEFARRAPRRD